MIALITAIPVVGPWLALAFSPVGRVVITLVGGLYAGWHLRTEVDTALQARAIIAVKEAHAKELEREAKAGRDLVEEHQRQEEIDEITIKDLRKRIEEDASKRPPDPVVCTWSDDRLQRVRDNFRGFSPGGSGSGKNRAK